MIVNIEDRDTALAQLIRLCEPYLEPAIATEGAKQTETAKVLGAIDSDGAGDVEVIVTADAMAESPKTISVAVEDDDSASVVAGKIREALAGDDIVSEFFDISGTGIKVVLITKEYDDNDSTMNLSIDNDTCNGLTAAPVSTTTTTGALPDLSEVEAILDDNFLAAWQADTAYAIGQHIHADGHTYIVTEAGTSGATTPDSWPTGIGAAITSGTVKFVEDGIEFIVGYDVQQAALECWRKKMARASEMISTPGIDQAKIFDRCAAMAAQYEPVCIG